MNQGKLSRRGHSLQGYLGGFFLPYASFHRLPPLSRCHDNAFVGFRIMLCDRHARVAAALFVSMAQYRRISPARLSQLRSRVSRSPSRPALAKTQRARVWPDTSTKTMDGFKPTFWGRQQRLFVLIISSLRTRAWSMKSVMLKRTRFGTTHITVCSLFVYATRAFLMCFITAGDTTTSSMSLSVAAICSRHSFAARQLVCQLISITRRTGTVAKM